MNVCFPARAFQMNEVGTWLEARQKKTRTEEMPDYPCDLVKSTAAFCFPTFAGSDHIKNTHEDLRLKHHIIKAVSNSKNRKVLSGSLGSDNEIM